VTRILGHVKILEKKVTVRFNTADPQKLAYWLREGLFAARYHDAFRHIAQLSTLYRFEVHPGSVIARYEPSLRSEDVEMARVDAEILSQDPDAIASEMGDILDAALSSTTLVEVTNLDEIIGSAIKYGKAVEEIVYPDARLSEDDMGRLFRWASVEGWKIVDQEEAGITLTQREVPVEICWRPKGELK
jgi:hypothetical protein